MQTPISLVVFFAIAATSAIARDATEFAEGEAVVTFRETASLEVAKNVLKKHSLKFDRHFAWLSAQRRKHTGLVQDKKRTTAQLIAELQREPDIEFAEPNYLRWIKAAPNDTYFGTLWGLQNAGQTVNGTGGTTADDIEFLAAWRLARPSAGEIVVGVIDTGVHYAHSDLAANMWINPGETQNNGLDDDANGKVDDYYGFNFADNNSNPEDSGEHGTHVAGTIAAAGNNQMGVLGVDFRAKIMALKASSDGEQFSSSAVIAAAEYATMMKGRGINVVALNASYAGGGFSSAERASIEAAGNAGIVFCAAAGNEGMNNNTTLTYPASYRLSNMIVVAASNQNDALASFSNYGSTTVDLAAPGVNILSTKPPGTGAGTSPAFLQVGNTSYSAIAMTFSGTTLGITGSIIDCGLGNPADFPPSVNGNIALLLRGTLTFSEKVTNAMAAGAHAAIVYNNASGNFFGTLQTDSGWIPAESISQADGLAIKAALPAMGTVIVPPDYQYLDGTSMATPHVAGAVAFAARNFPNETVAQRITRILTHVDMKTGLQGKVVTGGRLNLLRVVDTDGNGLPDWWEQMNFGQLTGVNPNADRDGDSMTNLEEFFAGTNPSDPQSVFRISSIVSEMNGTGFVITWTAVPGMSYRVIYGASLEGPWLNNLPNSQVTAQPGQTNLSYTDTTVLAETARFYRVELVEP